MSANAAILDLIDIRWSVRTRSAVDTTSGKAIAHGGFSMTLGTYDGPISRQMMADAINARGMHAGDVDDISCIDGAPSNDEVIAVLTTRGIQPEDVVEMIIQDVLVDDANETSSNIEIASSILEQRR